MQKINLDNLDLLKAMRCPKCGSQMSPLLFCRGTTCDFTITKEEFDRVTGLKRAPKMRNLSMDKNLSELNNMGHKEVTEDFSDSPFLDK